MLLLSVWNNDLYNKQQTKNEVTEIIMNNLELSRSLSSFNQINNLLWWPTIYYVLYENVMHFYLSLYMKIYISWFLKKEWFLSLAAATL